MNLTLFENHFHESSPGVRSGGENDVEAAAPEPTEGEAEDGRSAAGGVVLSLGLSALVTVAAFVVARRIEARRAELAAERREIEVGAVGYANDIAE
jgi:hypothetical protein